MLIHGDCMKLMPTLADNSVTLTLTDIPYGVVSRPSNGIRSFDKLDADVTTFALDAFLAEIVRVTAGSIYIFCGTEQVSLIRGFLVAAGLTTRLCCWQKKNPSPVNGQAVWLSGIEACVFGKKKGAVFNEFCKNPVWVFPTVRSKCHPTEKPLALCEYLVRVSSNPGDLVFDPCAGSGTTAVAAKNLGRRWLAYEINGDYVQVAQDRLDALA
jgi:DNA modification methylase